LKEQKQMISGNMADILSNIYLGYSLVWYHHHFKGDDILREECIKYLMQDTEYKMNLIISNYPITFSYFTGGSKAFDILPTSWVNVLLFSGPLCNLIEDAGFTGISSSGISLGFSFIIN
jgi:hypothetical protein